VERNALTCFVKFSVILCKTLSYPFYPVTPPRPSGHPDFLGVK
jgi:hypothetical protein